MTEQNPISRQARQEIRKELRVHRHPTSAEDRLDSEAHYNTRFSSAAEYETSFKEVLRGDSLERILERLPDQERIVMDLMSYGAALEDLPLRHGLAVALEDRRPEDMMERHAERIQLLAGDLMQGATWNAIKRWLDSQPVPDARFALIMARPVGGLTSVPSHSPLIAGIFVRRMWELLNPNGGEILTEFPTDIIQKVEPWIQHINAIPGITASLGDNKNISFPVVRIIRSPEAPYQLPLIER